MNPKGQQRRNQDPHQKPEEKEFDEKIIQIKRVSKKTKGGNNISFTSLVVIGDHKGKAGIGFSKAPDVLNSIRKSVKKGKKNMVSIDLVGANTIAHQVYHKRGAAVVLLKPAPEGTGVIAGGPVRAVVEAFGVQNIVTKCMGTANKASNVYATFEALAQLKKVKVTKPTEAKPEKKAEIKKPVATKPVFKKEIKKTVKKEIKQKTK
ncbi:30S ribosomal protein S5 [Candidatus Beckwithbacteria bacterium]|nr:30S ribosomal protein S5 [Candidatus Beckwithbacteria bacterium]